MPQFLSEDDLDLRVREPELLKLATEILGDAATPSDGFDPPFQAMVEQAIPFRASLGEIDPHLEELAGQAGGIDPHSLDDDVRTFLEHDLPAGSEIQKDFTDLLGVEPGGPGGPTPAGVVDVAPAIIIFPGITPEEMPYDPRTVQITNHLAVPVAILSVTLEGDNASRFQFVSSCPGSLASGHACGIDVAPLFLADHTIEANLVIVTDDPNSPHIVLLREHQQRSLVHQ